MPHYSTSVRVPPDQIDRMDKIIAAEPRMTSRNKVIATALDHWLKWAEEAIDKTKGDGPVPAKQSEESPMTTPTPIQKAIDDTIAKLVALRTTPYAESDLSLALCPRLECDLAMQFVEKLAEAFDGPFLAVAKDMGLATPSDFESVVSDASAVCDLDFDLKRLRKRYPVSQEADAVAQHLLSARDFGVGERIA